MRIGIIGGGQLGMMMAQSAIELGHEIYSLDPSDNCSITKYSKKHYCCNFDDVVCMEELFNNVDVVTYEFENIDYDTLKEFEKSYKIYPSSDALYYSQNRYVEKSFVKSLNINTVSFKKVSNRNELNEFAKNKKCVLKTLSGGYDGKGQVLIEYIINDDAYLLVDNCECIVEEYFDFDYETSLIVTRSHDLEIVFFPMSVNSHNNGILFKSQASSKFNKLIENKAHEYAKKIVESINLQGTLAIEFFVKGDEIVFNEMAPRPHNSGHYTIEGCNVSQFTNHILAVSENKLIKPVLLYESAMINIIGDEINKDFTKYEGVFHDYYKSEVKKGRKMAHITFIDNDAKSLEHKIEKYLEG